MLKYTWGNYFFPWFSRQRQWSSLYSSSTTAIYWKVYIYDIYWISNSSLIQFGVRKKKGQKNNTFIQLRMDEIDQNW